MREVSGMRDPNETIAELTTKELFRSPEHTLAWGYLSSFTYPWEALDGLKDFILQLGATLSSDRYEQREGNVWVAKSATVYPTATILGPAVIGERSEVRPGAFIRGSVLVGDDAVVGNSTELKNCILFDRVQVPHFNYVGDAILGYASHMGGGAITSNVKSDKSPVAIKGAVFSVETGRKKVGAMLGDFVEVGCNSVLNPGTVIGEHSNVYPLSAVRGYVPAWHIYKAKGEVVEKEGRA